MIESNIDISQWFDGVANGLDLFLVGENLTTRKNETRLKIDNYTIANQGDRTKNSTSVNLDLRLPNVEEYWQLKFTSYDEGEQKRAVQRTPLKKTSNQQNYGASLGLFKKLGNVRTAFQPRITLQDPLKVSHSISFESIADFKKYAVNPKLEFFANPDIGTGVFLALNINFILTKNVSLTLINDGEYQEKAHLFSVSNGFSLGQSISEKTSFSYNLMFDSNNRPNYHLDAYTFSYIWSHILYKKILDFQTGPYLLFSKDKSFVGTPGVTLNIGLNF